MNTSARGGKALRSVQRTGCMNNETVILNEHAVSSFNLSSNVCSLTSQMSTQQREMRQKREKQLSEWQPPKSASSSDSDTDNEITTGVDLTRWVSQGVAFVVLREITISPKPRVI